MGSVSKTDSSSYTFQLADRTVAKAKDIAQSFSHLGLQQTCVDTIAYQNVSARAEASRTQQREATSVDLTEAVKESYTLSVAACQSGYHVEAYTIGLCAAANKENCRWGSTRRVRAFTNGKVATPSAIDVKVDRIAWSIV